MESQPDGRSSAFLAERLHAVRFQPVLLADSEEAVQEMVIQYLGAEEVSAASGWEEALEVFKSHRFEYAIIDADLPGAPQPSECLQALLRIEPEAKVIFTSRRFPSGPLKHALASSWGHLLKPYTVENLMGIMDRQSVLTA